MSKTTRTITRLLAASLFMTTLQGCLTSVLDSAANNLANERVHQSPLMNTTGGSLAWGDASGGPKSFAPKIYKTSIYREIGFPQGFDGGAVELPNRHMNAVRNFQEESLKLVNGHRADARQAPLALNDALSAYAMVRSKEITEKWDHVRPNGQDALYYVGGGFRAENIAKNPTGTAKSFVDQWMASTSGHKETMLDGRYKTMGIGVALGGDREFYSAQLFGDGKPTTPYKFKTK